MAICAVLLPAVDFDDNCQTIVKGQVYKVFMTRATVEDVLTDVENLAEWTTRLDESEAIPGSGAAPIRELSGIGSWATGEVSDIAIPLDQVFSVVGNKVLNFKIYDLTPTNLELIIALRDAGTTQQKIWTQFDALIAGGNDGINCSCRADLVVPEGRTDPAYGEIVFTTKQSLNSVVETPHPTI